MFTALAQTQPVIVSDTAARRIHRDGRYVLSQRQRKIPRIRKTGTKSNPYRPDAPRMEPTAANIAKPQTTSPARMARTSAWNRFRLHSRSGRVNPAKHKGEISNAPAAGSWK